MNAATKPLVAAALLLVVAAPARANVAVTFDDGPESNYTIAAPELLRDHLPATFYIISGELGPAWGHVTPDQVRALAADGFEIGSHTVTHPDLSTLDDASVRFELAQSQTDLEALLGSPVTDFAYPYGGANAQVEADCLAVYATCRGFGGAGVNTPAAFDAGYVRTFAVNLDAPEREAEAWIDLGRSRSVLVVLVFHDIGRPPSSVYGTKPRRFRRIMRYLADAQLPGLTGAAATAMTMRQAVAW